MSEERTFSLAHSSKAPLLRVAGRQLTPGWLSAAHLVRVLQFRKERADMMQTRTCPTGSPISACLLLFIARFSACCLKFIINRLDADPRRVHASESKLHATQVPSVWALTGLGMVDCARKVNGTAERVLARTFEQEVEVWKESETNNNSKQTHQERPICRANPRSSKVPPGLRDIGDCGNSLLAVR
eukprot:m.140235 g.140235  ORF g.140235 m.140235 type:complete len:186 (+) comp52568_c2_seq14:213-770(+)